MIKTYEYGLKGIHGTSAKKGEIAPPETRSAPAIIYRKTGEASQPPVSGSKTSDTSVVDEIRQAIRAELTKNLKNLGINPEIQENSAQSQSVIDLFTTPDISPALSEPSVIPGSPVSVPGTPSHVGNGGSGPGFSHLSHLTHAASPQQMFATTHWKPKEPACFFGRSTEDIHTWTSLVRHYLAFVAGSDT